MSKEGRNTVPAMACGSVQELSSFIWRQTDRVVKTRLALVAALIAGGSVVTALGPVALKWVVDSFTPHAAGIAVAPVLVIGFYVSSQWLTRALGEMLAYTYSKAERRLFRSLRERLFAHLLQLPFGFHLRRQTGALSQILENGLGGFQMAVYHLTFAVFPMTVELITMVVVLARLAPSMFLWLFTGALVCYSVTYACAAVVLIRRAAAAADADTLANGAILDGIMNVEIVKYFTAESTVVRKARHALLHAEDEWISYYRRFSFAGLTVAAIFGAFLATAMLLAVRQIQHSHMTVGNFVLIYSYMLQITRPAEALGTAIQSLSRGYGMALKMMDLFREPPEPHQGVTAGAWHVRGKLKYEAVSVSYDGRRTALNDVSFEVAAGKTLGIVGASGSGKSTLVRLLVRFLEPDHGRILLDDRSIATLPLTTLRQSIAVVPQETILFDDTIGYNIGFGKDGATQVDIEQAARLARLHDFIAHLPLRYDTRVGERGIQLSAGERQRVSIARAAIKRPAIYVFDEATSSLDTNTEREILCSLRAMARSSTTIMIAHRLSTVVRADEIIVLDAGEIVERGAHGALLAKNGHYARFWRAQQSDADVA